MSLQRHTVSSGTQEQVASYIHFLEKISEENWVGVRECCVYRERRPKKPPPTLRSTRGVGWWGDQESRMCSALQDNVNGRRKRGICPWSLLPLLGTQHPGPPLLQSGQVPARLASFTETLRWLARVHARHVGQAPSPLPAAGEDAPPLLAERGLCSGPLSADAETARRPASSLMSFVLHQKTQPPPQESPIILAAWLSRNRVSIKLAFRLYYEKDWVSFKPQCEVAEFGAVRAELQASCRSRPAVMVVPLSGLAHNY